MHNTQYCRLVIIVFFKNNNIPFIYFICPLHACLYRAVLLYIDINPLNMNIVPPSAPISPYYTIISYDVSSFSVLLEWSYPHSNDGVGISNYTTTLKASHTLHTYVERGTTLPLSFLYNKMHTAQIAAMNCVRDRSTCLCK